MANTPQQVINVGAVANDGTGDSLRQAFQEVNDNFANVWAVGPVSTNVIIANNVISTTVTNMDLILAGNGIGNVQFNSTLVPRTDDVYDLGTVDRRFSTVFVGTGGIDVLGPTTFGNITANVVTSQTVTANVVTANTFSGNISGNSIVISGPNGGLVYNDNGHVNSTSAFTFNNLSNAVVATGNITAPNFIGNVVGNITGNITVPGASTEVLFNTNGTIDASSVFTFSKTSNVLAVSGNINSTNYFVGDGSFLTSVMADRGNDTNNWNALTQMGVYTVNRTSWSGVSGPPLDSLVFVGLLEVKTSTGNSNTTEQIFYPGTIDSADVKIQYNRSLWNGTWTPWVRMTNNGQLLDGGTF